jgi:hypothetical protein
MKIMDGSMELNGIDRTVFHYRLSGGVRKKEKEIEK